MITKKQNNTMVQNGTKQAETIIEVKDLVKHYGKLVAVDHLDLHIMKGEIYALLGPNGSGKTTTINSILSLLSYEQGDISILGVPMRPDSYAVKRQIGVVPQTISVFEELNVEQNIDFFCGLYIDERKRRKQLVEEAIEFVGLSDHRKFLPAQLSGGLKRRLNIACGMAHRPSILFLDEPTVAVDPQSRNKILENVKELNKQGVTIVYTTHYMEEVEELCDRVGIMDQGRMIAEGSTDEVKEMIDMTEIIRIELLQPDQQLNLSRVSNLPGVLTVRVDSTDLVIEMGRTSKTLLDVLQTVEASDIPYGQVYCARPTLNTVFLEITGKALRDS